jgi:DNA processing protein
LERKHHHRYLLALLNVPELGLQRTRVLLQKTGVPHAHKLFEMSPSELMRIDGIGRQVANNLTGFKDWDSVDRVLDYTEKCGAATLSIGDERYPELLKHIYDPPVLLWYKGDAEVFRTPGVAVIGTRRPSGYALDQTGEWVRRLVSSGLCINSGLAYGVDARAHQTALESSGKTIAVLGSGIDVIYPAKNKKLAAEIINNGGAVVSEYPPGTPPDAGNFPGRNRIVSGISYGTLVIESGVKGGSMITARYALDQNREVFVVPHQLGFVRGEGNNYLIRTGQGKLVQSIGDILDELGMEAAGNEKRAEPKNRWQQLDLNNQQRELCSLLEGESMHIDKISEKLDQPTYKLLPLILDLEILGVVRQRAGKMFELS